MTGQRRAGRHGEPPVLRLERLDAVLFGLDGVLTGTAGGMNRSAPPGPAGGPRRTAATRRSSSAGSRWACSPITCAAAW
ncbi:MAG: hypothetical protein ACYCVZ_17610 [Streptosporangiaceae bacterium]